jgi:hypothetical protein
MQDQAAQAVHHISHQSLWIQIPEIVVIPLVSFIIFLMMKAEPLTAEHGAEIGSELSILAAGACGAIFANDTLYNKWEIGLIVYGVLMVLLCILIAAILARISRTNQAKDEIVSAVTGALHVLIGAAPIGMVTALLVLGYHFNP